MLKRTISLSMPSRRSLLASLSIAGGFLAGSPLSAAGKEAAKESPPASVPAVPPAVAEEAAAISPQEQRVHELLQQISQLFMQRRLKDASALLDEVEKLDPGSQEAKNIRAAIFSENGEFDKAREIYRKELEANPEAFVPAFNIVELLCMQKQYDQAREGFEKLLVKFPENDFLQFKILLTCLAQGKMTEANAWAQKLQRSVQTPIMIYAAAAIALRSGDLNVGRKLILLAESQFGAGNQFLLYQSLAGINLVLATDYPPKPVAAE